MFPPLIWLHSLHTKFRAVWSVIVL